MSVNLSPRQLAEPALPNDVARVLARDRARIPTALWLEITESTLMRDAESALERARRAARARACTSSVDDFGSGYSSLAYLQRLPGRGAEDRPLVHRRASATRTDSDRDRRRRS